MGFSDWKEVRLGDVVTLNYGKGLPAKKRILGNVPVYSSAGITGRHNEPLVPNEGIIVGRKGTVGSVYYSKKPFYCIDTAFYLTKDDTEQCLKYIYYLLKYLPLTKLNTDSAVPGLNRDNAYSQPVNLPPLNEQKSIAKILSSLDEKIELNNQINKTLEEIAQTIFKHWFIDFEFPNENGEPYKSSGGEMVESELGMIPKGWEVKSLDSIAEYLNGLAMQKFRPDKGEKSFPVLKIKELRQGFTDNGSDRCTTNLDGKYIVEDGDVIFSWSGSLLVEIWCGGKCGLNQHLFKVTSSEHKKWFYYLWTKHFLEKFDNIAKSKATTMGHIRRKDLTDSKVFLPDSKNYERASQILEPIYNKIIKLNLESKNLVQLRDTLLPKLMSGEIPVPLEKAE